MRIGAGSQAGTLAAAIQTPNATPDVAASSGLPSGSVITNGTAGTAAITGGVVEVVTLTFTTEPTPTGFHWLVFTATSGGTVDVEITYSGDYTLSTSPFNRALGVKSYNGADWDNAVSVGLGAVALFTASGNIIDYFADICPPYFTTAANMEEAMLFDNKEVIGFKFTAKTNLIHLVGVMWQFSATGADQNFQMKIATAAGSVIGTSSIYNEQSSFAASREAAMYFNAPITLTAGTTYRCFLMNPNDTADDIGLLYWDLSSAGDQTTFFGMDSGEFALSTATNPPEYGAGGAGSWTDDDTVLPSVNLIFKEDIEDITGGGGATSS